MNLPHADSDKPEDPEALLAGGLRGTTPAFEARFDALRRRLASEPTHRTLLERLVGTVRGHRVFAGATLAGALVGCAAAVLLWSRSREAIMLREEQRWYADVLAWDDSLRDGAVLTDAEARETLFNMPLEAHGGGS